MSYQCGRKPNNPKDCPGCSDCRPEGPDPTARYPGEPEACTSCGETKSHPLIPIKEDHLCVECLLESEALL